MLTLPNALVHPPPKIKLNRNAKSVRFTDMSTATLEKVSQLDQLKQFTKVVADTGDFESMRDYKPQDATTNPSLILQAIQKPEYGYLLDKVLTERRSSEVAKAAQIEDIIDHLLVAFGLQILQIVPGRVSTETDARLS